MAPFVEHVVSLLCGSYTDCGGLKTTTGDDITMLTDVEKCSEQLRIDSGLKVVDTYTTGVDNLAHVLAGKLAMQEIMQAGSAINVQKNDEARLAELKAEVVKEIKDLKEVTDLAVDTKARLVKVEALEMERYLRIEDLDELLGQLDDLRMRETEEEKMKEDEEEKLEEDERADSTRHVLYIHTGRVWTPSNTIV